MGWQRPAAVQRSSLNPARGPIMPDSEPANNNRDPVWAPPTAPSATYEPACCNQTDPDRSSRTKPPTDPPEQAMLNDMITPNHNHPSATTNSSTLNHRTTSLAIHQDQAASRQTYTTGTPTPAAAVTTPSGGLVTRNWCRCPR